MSWHETEFGWFSESTGQAPAELLVAIFPDDKTPDGIVRVAAATWARSLPTAAFLIFGRPLAPAAIGTRLREFLALAGLPPSRLLLVGLTDGAMVGFSIVIGASQPVCAGMLAYDAVPLHVADLSAAGRHTKLRLIGCLGKGVDEELFARAIRDLGTLGADVRGTLLREPGLTPSAIRLGAAYLGELSASALDIPPSPAAVMVRPALAEWGGRT